MLNSAAHCAAASNVHQRGGQLHLASHDFLSQVIEKSGYQALPWVRSILWHLHFIRIQVMCIQPK